MKLSELYGMQVEKINSKRRGYVLCAYAENDKLSHLVCCDGEENEFCVAADDVISMNNCVIYRSECKRIAKKSALRLGAPCCDERGKILGVTQDYTLNGLNVKSARIGGKNYAFSRLVTGDVVIVKDKNKPDVAASITARDLFIGAVCDAPQEGTF